MRPIISADHQIRANGPQERIAGRRVDGKIQLYVRHQGGLGDRLIDKLSGKTDRERALARQAISEALTGLKSRMSNGELRKEIDALIQQIPNGSHDIKRGDFDDLLKKAADVEQRYGQYVRDIVRGVEADSAKKAKDARIQMDLADEGKNKARHAAPLMTTVGSRARLESKATPAVPMLRREAALIDPGQREVDKLVDQKWRDQLASLPTDKSQRDVLAQQLGDHIAKGLKDGNDRDLEMSFATAAAGGKAFKTALLQSVGSKAASKGLEEVIDSAYARAITRLTNHFVDDNTVVVADKRYVKERELGKGGYARADLYCCSTKDPQGKETKEYIVIKSPIGTLSRGDRERALRRACSEVRAHRSAERDGHPSIVGLKGAIPTSDGRLLIALEYAPGGDLSNVSNTVRTLDGVSQRVRNALLLTLMKDMAGGVNHMHGVGGVIHRDVKMENALLGADGRVKNADFGESVHGPTVVFTKDQATENPFNLSPEGMKAYKELKRKIKTIREGLAQAANAQGMPKDERLKLRDLMEATTTVRVPDGQRADSWALGAALYQIYYGEAPFDGDRPGMVWDKVEAFSEHKSNRVRPVGLTIAGDRGKGLSAVDRLLNQLMAPKSPMRYTADQALQSSAFTENPDVGSDEVRAILQILAVGGGKKPSPEALVRISAVAKGIDATPFE